MVKGLLIREELLVPEIRRSGQRNPKKVLRYITRGYIRVRGDIPIRTK
jgi:hypothetical protein